MDLIPIGIALVAIFNLGFTVFLTRRAETKTRTVLEGLGNSLQDGLDAINADLEPIITANSRAMGAISHLSDDTKMDQALERRIGKDLLGQNADVLEMIEMAFPNVKEYLDDHPEAMTKLLPRLNTLISDPDARKRLNLDLSRKGGDLSRIWSDR